MKKCLKQIGALIFSLIVLVGVSGFVAPNIAQAAENDDDPGACLLPDTGATISTIRGVCVRSGGVFTADTATKKAETTVASVVNTLSWWDNLTCGEESNWISCGFRNFFATIVQIVLSIVSLITMIGGVMLNGAIYHTVVNISKNYDNLPAINTTWRVVRDVANMTFIFVLLYAAIRTMLGLAKDTQRLIVNMVIVAVLINFSLFFTKIVIDLSNLMSLTFYDAMVPGAAEEGFSAVFNGQGLADAFMDKLNLQSLYDAGGSNVTFKGLITTSVMGSIMLLIAAFVFFAAAIMFIIRYVVLIMVLILSPLAFIAMILPEAKGLQKQWTDALIGQAMFAPVYMMMTWITLKVLAGITDTKVFSIDLTKAAFSAETSNPAITAAANSSNALGIFPVFINFALVIIFLITSLIVAKSFADKTPGGIGKLTSWASGVAGTATFGLGAWAGRKTMGAYGNSAAGNAELQRSAREDKGAKGAWSRLKLYGAQTARSGTFDVRNATIPTRVIGDAIEGTVGRTSFGRRMGLDEVNIPSIPLGAPLTSQLDSGKPAEGGYKEEKAAKAKRMETAKRESDEEYRKVRAMGILNNVVNPAAGTVPTTAQITEVQELVKDMTGKEVAALDKNTLANEHVAEALTASHLKAIEDDKDGKYSESDKREIFSAHFAKVEDAVEALRNPAAFAALPANVQTAHKNAIKNVSDKEIDYIPASIFDPRQLSSATPDGERSRAFLQGLTQPQVDNLTKGDKYVASEKQAIKDTKAKPLNDAFTAGTGLHITAAGGAPARTGYEEAIRIMSEMRPETLIQLDTPKLIDSKILTLYRPGLLNKMAARPELTEAKASAIRKAIKDAANAPGTTPIEIIEAAMWLDGDGLKIF